MYTSRTDLTAAQLPNPIPTMGPAGSVITDPDFGNRIVRATDSLTDKNPGFTYHAGMDGSADSNSWNTDSTMLAVQASGTTVAIIGFTPSTMAVQRLFPNWRAPGTSMFSKVNPNYLYSRSGTKILLFDLTNRTALTPPSPVTVCDFATILPAGTVVSWGDFGGVEALDTMFTTAFSSTGGQDTGVWVCSYVVGMGYSVYNTSTGVVTLPSGTTANIVIPDRFNVHNVRSSKGFGWLIIQAGGSGSINGSPISGSPYFWEIGTANVIPVGKTWSGGHWVAGERHYYNGGGTGFGNIVQRAYLNTNNPVLLMQANQIPPGYVPPSGLHISLNGTQAVNPLFVTWEDDGAFLGKPFPSAWYNEVVGVSVDGSGIVHRFCHHFSTCKSSDFSATNAIGVVDQQNKYFAFSSDWMATLGRSCDVFIVELK